MAEWYDFYPDATASGQGPLESHPIKNMPAYMTLPNVSGSPMAKSGAASWTKFIPAALGGVGALLAGGSDPRIDATIDEVQRNARGDRAEGKGLVRQGEAALNPALAYFQKLLSGDPQDILSATAPERSRVIDQYGAARRSAAEFTPRGGGQASASMESRSREASDLSILSASARQGAARDVASIGESLTGKGLSAEEAATTALAQTLSPLLDQQKTDQSQVADIFSGIGDILAASFL